MGLPLGLLLVLQQPIIVDGHIDTPQRMLDMKADISARLTDGHIDVPRMREGGLTAAFFSIWVDARYARGTAFQRALDLIGAVRALADTNRYGELATPAPDVRASGGGTDEPAGNAGGRFTRLRCDVPGCPGHHHATGDRVTLVVPRPGPPPAQLERRAAPGHYTERRRGGDQFLSRIPGRALSEPVR